MITEDYVNFEVAKLLKEKGFDAQSPMIYTADSKLIYTSVKYHNMYAVTNKYLEHYTDIIAPSQTMAMKWLREVHNIFLSIQQHMDMSYVWYAYVNGAAKGCDRESHNNTYEEACEAAIKYCLENLI